MQYLRIVTSKYHSTFFITSFVLLGKIISSQQLELNARSDHLTDSEAKSYQAETQYNSWEHDSSGRILGVGCVFHHNKVSDITKKVQPRARSVEDSLKANANSRIQNTKQENIVVRCKNSNYYTITDHLVDSNNQSQDRLKNRVHSRVGNTKSDQKIITPDHSDYPGAKKFQETSKNNSKGFQNSPQLGFETVTEFKYSPAADKLKYFESETENGGNTHLKDLKDEYTEIISHHSIKNFGKDAFLTNAGMFSNIHALEESILSNGDQCPESPSELHANVTQPTKNYINSGCILSNKDLFSYTPSGFHMDGTQLKREFIRSNEASRCHRYFTYQDTNFDTTKLGTNETENEEQGIYSFQNDEQSQFPESSTSHINVQFEEGQNTKDTAVSYQKKQKDNLKDLDNIFEPNSERILRYNSVSQTAINTDGMGPFEPNSEFILRYNSVSQTTINTYEIGSVSLRDPRKESWRSRILRILTCGVFPPRIRDTPCHSIFYDALLTDPNERKDVEIASFKHLKDGTTSHNETRVYRSSNELANNLERLPEKETLSQNQNMGLDSSINGNCEASEKNKAMLNDNSTDKNSSAKKTGQVSLMIYEYSFHGDEHALNHRDLNETSAKSNQSTPQVSKTLENPEFYLISKSEFSSDIHKKTLKSHLKTEHSAISNSYSNSISKLRHNNRPSASSNNLTGKHPNDQYQVTNGTTETFCDIKQYQLLNNPSVDPLNSKEYHLFNNSIVKPLDNKQYKIPNNSIAVDINRKHTYSKDNTASSISLVQNSAHLQDTFSEAEDECSDMSNTHLRKKIYPKRSQKPKNNQHSSSEDKDSQIYELEIFLQQRKKQMIRKGSSKKVNNIHAPCLTNPIDNKRTRISESPSKLFYDPLRKNIPTPKSVGCVQIVEKLADVQIARSRPIQIPGKRASKQICTGLYIHKAKPMAISKNDKLKSGLLAHNTLTENEMTSDSNHINGNIKNLDGFVLSRLTGNAENLFSNTLCDSTNVDIHKMGYLKELDEERSRSKITQYKTQQPFIRNILSPTESSKVFDSVDFQNFEITPGQSKIYSEIHPKQPYGILYRHFGNPSPQTPSIDKYHQKLNYPRETISAPNKPLSFTREFITKKGAFQANLDTVNLQDQNQQTLVEEKGKFKRTTVKSLKIGDKIKNRKSTPYSFSSTDNIPECTLSTDLQEESLGCLTLYKPYESSKNRQPTPYCKKKKTIPLKDPETYTFQPIKQASPSKNSVDIVKPKFLGKINLLGN